MSLTLICFLVWYGNIPRLKLHVTVLSPFEKWLADNGIKDIQDAEIIVERNESSILPPRIEINAHLFSKEFSHFFYGIPFSHCYQFYSNPFRYNM